MGLWNDYFGTFDILMHLHCWGGYMNKMKTQYLCVSKPPKHKRRYFLFKLRNNWNEDTWFPGDRKTKKELTAFQAYMFIKNDRQRILRPADRLLRSTLQRNIF